MTEPQPVAYALRLTTGPRAGHLEPRLYKSLETAQRAWAVMPHHEVLPVVTLDRLEAQAAATRAAEALADAQTHAVTALKAETITLRNEIAALKGQLIAQAHAHPVEAD